MVAPLTPNEIIAALKAWSIPYVEEPDWRTRSNGRAWGDITGFMWHHTGDDATDLASKDVIRDGHANLSGPLSQFALRDDGVVHVIAAGCANHAGGGDTAVLAAVRTESYDTAPPAPRFTHADLVNGKAGTINGNPLFYGVESLYYAKNTPAQRQRMPHLAAAIIWALDRKDPANQWTARSGIGHKEWQRGKVDPNLFGQTMATLRAETQAYLDTGPRPMGPEEDDGMKLTDKITVSLPTGTGTEEISYATYLNRQNWVYLETVRQRDQLARLVAESAAQSAALKALQEDPDVRIEDVMTAAKAGALAALDERIKDVDIDVVVSPPA
jgi:hypothetical protein